MKIIVYVNFGLILFLFSCENGGDKPLRNKRGEIGVNAKVIYPKSRQWAFPSAGLVPRFNPPSLLWPVVKTQGYDVQLSQSNDFSAGVIEGQGLPYAMFNPHQKLNNGTWFWRYKPQDASWSETNTFNITEDIQGFVTPSASKFLLMIPNQGPRVYAWKSQLNSLRERAKNYIEAQAIVGEANELLGFDIPKEEKALPKFEGRNKRESRRIAIDASRRVCDQVQHVVSRLAQAYLLTGEEKYANIGINWIMELTGWDPEGATRVTDFGDSGIMHAMAVGYDTFGELLSQTQKDKLLQAIAARGAHFYEEWPNFLEARLISNHVWQHILERFFQTALGVKGDLPQADEWLTYVYEIWLANSPKLGHKDGAWSNGISYFRMNTLTMLSIASTLKEITGVEFLNDEWYYNNPEWMIYAWPPNGTSDGFGNDAYKLGNEEYPNESNAPIFTSYPELNARLTGNPYAAWYAEKRIAGTTNNLSDDPSLKWFFVQRGLTMQRPKPIDKFDLPQGRVFREVGVAYMNTDLANSRSNLKLSFKSSPYGSYSHTHAEHNCFNLFYGGKPLFSNSGYRPAMGDPHYLADFKNTRGHNGILINDKGQPFGSEAYGWIPRFIQGEQISYVVGDATNAYNATDANELSDLKNPAQNNADAGLKRFRRHILMLKPSTIIVYDDLETQEPSDFTFLLQNRDNMDFDGNTITTKNELASANSTLFCSSDIVQEVSNKFISPPENWRRKTNPDGSLLEYKNHYHYRATNKEKVKKIRYLSIIQIDSEDGTLSTQKVIKEGDTFRVREWLIKAQMSVNQPACLVAKNLDDSAVFASSGTLSLDGRNFGTTTGSSKLVEMVGDLPVFQEVVDELPESIENVLAIMNNK